MGMAATSYIDNKRSDRPRKMRDYLTMIEKEDALIVDIPMQSAADTIEIITVQNPQSEL